MKANELMIGDWVEIQDTPRYYKVEGIDILAKGDACRLTFEDYVVDTWCDRVKPIPLTEDILKANGFECPFEERTYELRNMEYSIYVCFKRFCVNIQVHFREIADEAFIRVHCNSVHELQRALRCCGLFDLSNNFKV